jgi:hypothetical protein
MLGRSTGVLLLAGYFALQGWAQEPTGQTPPKADVSSERTSADQNQPSEQSSSAPPSSAQSSPAGATTESPLDKFQNFSAIQNGGPLPGMDEDRYIYRSGNLMRMQGDAAVPEYYVTDLIKQQTTSATARGCLKTDNAYKRSFPFFISRPGVTYERIPIGEATVDGHPCHVEDLLIHRTKNAEVLRYRLSEADDLQGFPIKIENHREHAYPWVIHYKDVRIGPQDPTLFIVPEKCQTMAGFQKAGPGSKAKPSPPAKPQ